MIPLIWEGDGHTSPGYSQRAAMYGVGGIPHAEFNGIVNSIGGGTNMYPYYLNIYEDLIDDDSPVYIDFITYLNQDDGGLDLVADVVMTGDITTSDNKVVFLLTYKYTNDYFCTVEGYEQVDFDLNAEGETGVYTHHFSVDPAWDMSSIHTIALIQSYSSSSKEIYQGMTTNEWQDPTMDMTLAYSGDWVTVGLPLGMDNDYYLNIFPDAFENTLFSYNNTNGYELETNVENGVGYWIRFGEEGGYSTLNGFEIEEITIPVEQNWNIISGISTPVYTNAILDPDGLIVPNTIYSFEQGYSEAGMIFPGKGYWLRSYADGEITITTMGEQAKAKPFVDRMADANMIRFNDIPLYFGVNVPEAEILSYSLPPKPPAGAFDVRFSDDMIYSENSGNIELMKNTNKVDISFDIKNDAEDGKVWVLVNSKDGSEYILNGTGTVEIANLGDNMQLTKRSVTTVPDELVLLQNYPNPFNPVTSIQYEITQQSHVELMVHNIAGQEIARLVDGFQDAGLHEAVFNAASIPTGMYLYTLKTERKTIIKKMMVMK